MQTLKQIYRATYGGEHVISELSYKDDNWEVNTEYVENSVFSTHTTGHALAIANGESRLGIDLTHIANHKGGLLGENRLQTYGCNALYRDFTPDFLVAVGTDTPGDIIEEIANSGYADNNIVYTNTYGILNHPGKFYLVPQNVHYDSGSLAAYMACFDGHKKVFLLGYDNYSHEHQVNNVYKGTNTYSSADHIDNGAFFEMSLRTVMETYPDVEFVRVAPTADTWCPASWSALLNFRQIDFRAFVFEADIG